MRDNEFFYNLKTKQATLSLHSMILRDGPFDIQGGWDFSSRQVIFFSL